MTTKEAALSFAKKGWHVIPVHSVRDNGFCSCGAAWDYSIEPKHAIGKHPYHGEKGHRESSDNEMQILTWWMQWPDANLAVVTGEKSGLIVVDVDKKSGGLDSLKKLFDQFEKFPPTPTVHSGGGGLHFYFQHPGFEVRGRRGMVPGIDVMADGGRIVAPPSKHKNGSLYTWDKEFSDEIPVAKIPKWLLDMILSKQSKRRKESKEEGPEEKEVRISFPRVIKNQRFGFR